MHTSGGTASFVGQTRPGRIGDTPPSSTGQGTAGPAQDIPVGGDARQTIDQALKNFKVVVFSKVICPSCRKAKEIMSKYIPGRFAAVDLDTRPDGEQLKAALEQMTGKHTVPHIFINGKFIGGADELGAMESSGQLAPMLQDV